MHYNLKANTCYTWHQAGHIFYNKESTETSNVEAILQLLNFFTKLMIGQFLGSEIYYNIVYVYDLWEIFICIKLANHIDNLAVLRTNENK